MHIYYIYMQARIMVQFKIKISTSRCQHTDVHMCTTALESWFSKYRAYWYT